MHGIEPLGGVAAQLDFVGDAAGGFLGGLARYLVRARRCIHPLDQLQQRAFDFADLGELRLGPAKLLGHIGNLALDRLKRERLRGFERLGEIAADLVEPRAQGIERRRHRHADRILEAMRHLGETLIELAVAYRRTRAIGAGAE